MATGCLHRPTTDPNVIVVAIQSAPNNLDPRFGTDDASQKIDQLIFDSLMGLDEHLRVAPRLADRLDHPDPLTYVATLRQGVHFHDGHELTSADVVYTFRGSDRAGFDARRGAAAIARLPPSIARDRYTVVFTLKAAVHLVSHQPRRCRSLPDGAGAADPRPLRSAPVPTGSCGTPWTIASSSRRFDDYFGGPAEKRRHRAEDRARRHHARPRAAQGHGRPRRQRSDAGHRLRAHERRPPAAGRARPAWTISIIGVNLRDPVLKDVRVRQAIAYAIDRHAIVDYLRRGLAVPATGMLAAQSWAFAPDAFSYPYDPARARSFWTRPAICRSGRRRPATAAASHAEDRQHAGVQSRCRRPSIQQNLRDVGIDLDVRNYEFATMYNDVVKGNFQLYSLQWTAGSLADPDILRRVFHSKQTPPAGFNRGHFNDPEVDALLERPPHRPTSRSDAHCFSTSSASSRAKCRTSASGTRTTSSSDSVRCRVFT